MREPVELTPAQHLARMIESDGPVSIATFMELALAHPRLGYYSTRPGIGADGDFITAPETSQLFGEMIGVWVLQTWLDLGSPTEWQLIELGPGRGTLMNDLLRVLKLRPQALESASIHLVETSPALYQAQRESLAPFAGAVHWHDHIAAIPGGVGVIVANEFFDALPIRQFLRLKGIWCERRVALQQGATFASPAFDFVAVPTTFNIEAELLSARDAAEGEIIEISQASRAIASAIGSRLAHAAGRALIIDYGYGAEKHGDTLQALRRHQKVGVLTQIGLADITAHVDFTAIARAAMNAGAHVHGVVTQGAFLERIGLETRLGALTAAANADTRERLNRERHRLTSPSEMGDLFRALCLSSPNLPSPPGF